MKRLIILLALVLFAAAGCQEKKPADYTRLGFYTQYQTYMEKLNGKVESVAEKGYWAVHEGDTYVRGARITKKELDSIGYTYDYKATFDADGYPVSSTTYDENDKGFQSEATFLDKDKNVTAKTSTSYEYDEKGNWIKGIIKDQKGFTIICERVYTYF